jgi:hypothetical protein
MRLYRAFPTNLGTRVITGSSFLDHVHHSRVLAIPL